MSTSRNSKNFPSITKHPKHLMSRVLWRLLAFLVLNKPQINDQNAGRLSIQLIPNFKHSCNLQITKSSSCSWISSESLHNFNRFFYCCHFLESPSEIIQKTCYGTNRKRYHVCLTLLFCETSVGVCDLYHLPITLLRWQLWPISV